MKILIRFLFVMILSIGFYATSQQSQQPIKQPPIENKKKQSENQQKITYNQAANSNSQTPILPIDQFRPPKPLQKIAKNKQENSQWPPDGWRNILKNPTSIFTGILAAFTIFLVAIGWLQLNNVHKATIRQLRAYIFSEGFKLVDDNATNIPNKNRSYEPGVVFAIKNSGQTPAYEVKSFAAIDIIEPKKANCLIVPKLSECYSVNNIGPGGIISKAVWFGRSFNNEEIGGIERAVLAIYIHGRIEYKDTFKRKRYTNFRLRYYGKFPNPEDMAFSFCEKGNEAN